jgi:hypothetical protein
MVCQDKPMCTNPGGTTLRSTGDAALAEAALASDFMDRTLPSGHPTEAANINADLLAFFKGWRLPIVEVFL